MNAEGPGPGIEVMLHVLCHLNRARILSLLRKQDICVHTLATILRMKPKEVIRHVSYLRRAGLVVPSKRCRGRENFYTLAPVGPPLHWKLLKRVLDCLAELPEIEEDAARARIGEGAATCGPLRGAVPRRGRSRGEREQNERGARPEAGQREGAATATAAPLRAGS